MSETAAPCPQPEDGPLLRCARFVLLALIFSLAFMQPNLMLLRMQAQATDLLFLLAAALWLGALVKRETRLRWDKGHWVLLVYLAALASSVPTSIRPETSAIKMATQLYLAGLAFLASSLIRDEGDLRLCLRSWLAGTVVVALVALVSLALFAFDPANPILDYTRFHFGTLPAGNYPRFELTFINANMLCNYLSVSMMILIVAGRLGWAGKSSYRWLLAGICLCAGLTISPGIGGFLLVAGIWFHLAHRNRNRLAARLVLAGTIASAVLFIAVLPLTPIVHATAPWVIRVPGLGVTLAPSGRMMTWTAAARTFLANPYLGQGIGVNPVLVHYRDPSGYLQTLTDAHDSYLSIAAQCGIPGLAALLLLIGWVWVRTRPFRLSPTDRNVARLGFGIAFLGAFAYQGLGGSFQDARHLWVVLGFFIASIRIEAMAAGKSTIGEPCRREAARGSA